MRSILIFIILVCTMGAAKTQDSWVGLKLGLNQTNLIANGSFEYTAKQGFEIGYSFERELNTSYTVGVDMTYIKKGALAESAKSLNGSAPPFKEKISYKYINIPIHFSRTKEIGNALKVFGRLEIIQGIAIESTGQYYDDASDEIESYSTFDFVKKYDAGLGLKVGLHWELISKLRVSPYISSDFSLINHISDDVVNPQTSLTGELGTTSLRHYGVSYGILVSTNL